MRPLEGHTHQDLVDECISCPRLPPDSSSSLQQPPTPPLVTLNVSALPDPRLDRSRCIGSSMQVKVDGRREGFYFDGYDDGDEPEEPETPDPPPPRIFERRHSAPAYVKDGTMERTLHLEQLVRDLEEENARLKAEIRRLTAPEPR